MKTIELTAMQAHCDKLTADGKQLSIKWEGGNDSGWFQLLLDGVQQTTTADDDALLTYVEDVVGYGSFAGDFSTEGTIVYNREAKCFIGEDLYTETDQGIAQCEINFAIPDEVWFDNIILRVGTEGWEEHVDCTLELVISNGPHPGLFDPMKEELEAMLHEKFSDLSDSIPDFSGFWHTYNIPRRDLVANDGKLHCKITEINYSCNKELIQGVRIPLHELSSNG